MFFQIRHLRLFWVCLVLLWMQAGFADSSLHQSFHGPSQVNPEPVNAHKLAPTDSLLRVAFIKAKFSFPLPIDSKVESYRIDTVRKTIVLYCNDHFAAQPFREAVVKELKDTILHLLSRPDYHVSIITLGYEINELIPNFYRSRLVLRDDTRQYRNATLPAQQVVRGLSKPYNISKGLQNRNIVLWPSHGWYYNNKIDRWEWQRPRMFQSVEDLLPYSFCIPFLIPMLENAGANVFVPRERDWQINEVVVDNDNSTDNKTNRYAETGNHKLFKYGEETGFAMPHKELEDKENPFLAGTFRTAETDVKETAAFHWTPEFPANGDYAVYITYHASLFNTSAALYSVKHTGGVTLFSVNQKIGGSTWFYLGTFHFQKGKNTKAGSVELSNQSALKGELISADAVRFGGGMSVVKKNGNVSGRPKFSEGARYWLQYAGMPDTLVYALNNDDDYKDDFQSRAEYGNYLHGAPFGPNKDRSKGLGVPIDLSLGFHTDAGQATGDTTVGTLAIYSLKDALGNTSFPNAVSRMTNRDLADIIQTQVVDDIRKQFDSAWVRRDLRNAEYSESARPNSPGVLLELLAHQNFNDMRYAQTPEFRFAVSRSIYKAIVKYLSDCHGEVYCIQPLPPTGFSAMLGEENTVTLKWLPQADKSEPDALPKNYVVYERVGENGFNNGKIVNGTEFTRAGLEPGKIYRFKVAGVNAGGEGFPTEELSVGVSPKSKGNVLVVNGFHRTSSPAWVQTPSITGFINNADEGVPSGLDVSFTGVQNDFSPESPYISNDAPGFGAGSADQETRLIAGNTFNYPYVHGKAIMDAGYSFASSSDDAVMRGQADFAGYPVVDLIYGEEKTSQNPNPAYAKIKSSALFPAELVMKLKEFIQQNGSLLVSGAYIASDPYLQKQSDSSAYEFITKQLHFGFNALGAAKTGSVAGTKNISAFSDLMLRYNTGFCDSIYRVEAPGALLPGKDANVILRYEENGFPAGVGFKGKYGVVALGFPFETVLDERTRGELMKKVMEFITDK